MPNEKPTQKTITFTIEDDGEKKYRYFLRSVYDALEEKGFDPVNQIVGYILSDDPTYITSYKNARTMICKMDRNELLHMLVSSFLKV